MTEIRITPPTPGQVAIVASDGKAYAVGYIDRALIGDDQSPTYRADTIRHALARLDQALRSVPDGLIPDVDNG